jgi:hypothetical protein
MDDQKVTFNHFPRDLATVMTIAAKRDGVSREHLAIEVLRRHFEREIELLATLNNSISIPGTGSVTSF